MEINLTPAMVYSAAVVALIGLHLAWRARASRRVLKRQEAAKEAGMNEPPTLHPWIDPGICLGCASCVTACPEKTVLGVIDGKAELVEAAHCVGHGACKTACPLDAITLVFGTEKRGVDIPNVSPEFETNVPGIFIAGELGGMGLVRNAVEQGRQALENAEALCREPHDCDFDVAIIGAGPAGIAASLGAKALGLSYRTIDQDSLGGTVAHFPRRKVVMTAPAILPLVGKVNFRETTKEALIEFWEKVVADHQLEIGFNNRMEVIEPLELGFKINTSKESFSARAVLLCLGRRGTPRKLGVEGEHLDKVVYRLVDPEQYRGMSVLVVGGGDSAVEAAVSLSEEPGTNATLAYRGPAFNRIKPGNRERLDMAQKSGALRVCYNTNIDSISPGEVVLVGDQGHETVANEAVIVCAGGVLPRDVLEKIGIQFERKHGTA